MEMAGTARREPAATSPQMAFGVLAWAHFLNDAYVNYVPALLPVLMLTHHFPVALAGTLVLALQGVTAMFQPLVGLWADRLGGRLFPWVGLGLAAVGASAVGLAPSYLALLAVLLLTGIGNTLFHPQALAAASALTRRRRGLGTSAFLVAGELGRGLGPLIMSALVAWRGLGALTLALVPALVTLPILARTTPVQARSPAVGDGPSPFAGKGGRTALLVAYAGLRATGSFGLLTFVPIFWKGRGGSLVGGASLLSVLLVVGIVGNLAGGWLADRAGRRALLSGSAILSAILLAAFIGAHGLWSWVTMGATGIALFSTMPVTMLVSHDLFPTHRSMASGLAIGSGNAAGALAAFALGPVAAAWGVHAALWAVVAALLLAAPVARFLPAGGSQRAS